MIKKLLPFVFLLFCCFGCKKSNHDTADIELTITEADVPNNPDWKYIYYNTSIADTLARASLYNYGDFDTINHWSDADINIALQAVIPLHYTPTAGYKYTIIFTIYAGVNTFNMTSRSFHYDGRAYTLVK